MISRTTKLAATATPSIAPRISKQPLKDRGQHAEEAWPVRSRILSVAQSPQRSARLDCLRGLREMFRAGDDVEDHRLRSMLGTKCLNGSRVEEPPGSRLNLSFEFVDIHSRPLIVIGLYFILT
jgi:hypothetical protein